MIELLGRSPDGDSRRPESAQREMHMKRGPWKGRLFHDVHRCDSQRTTTPIRSALTRRLQLPESLRVPAQDGLLRLDRMPGEIILHHVP